jgi:hypothetical protein
MTAPECSRRCLVRVFSRALIPADRTLSASLAGAIFLGSLLRAMPVRGRPAMWVARMSAMSSVLADGSGLHVPVFADTNCASAGLILEMVASALALFVVPSCLQLQKRGSRSTLLGPETDCRERALALRLRSIGVPWLDSMDA